jgi:HPr kinase/phosphorylase
VVDLAATDAERIPAPAALRTELLGVTLPRLPVAAGSDPLPVVLQALVQLPAQA